MPDREERTERPILFGLAALVGVGLAVGLVLGLSVLAGTHFLGVGGSSDASTSSARQSMYLPKPQPTEQATGAAITLAPGQTPSASQSPTEKPSKSTSPTTDISLSAGETSVSPMQQIDLTGVYSGGEGAILQVQRRTNGSWTDFPVTVSVINETFSTYVQTSQPGQNRFRVIDTDSGLTSNVVRVAIG